MLISSDAIALKATAYSESSLIVRLFTLELGKVTVIAKGARRQKNPLAALLEPMCLVTVEFYHKTSRDIQTLKEVSLAHSAPNIRRDLTKMSLGLAITEIIDKAIAADDPGPILFRLTWKVLQNLETSEGIDHLLFLFFMLQLAIRTGFKPNLEHCSSCIKPLSEAWFSRDSGDLQCPVCRHGGEMMLEGNSLNLLRQLAVTHIDKIGDLAQRREELDKTISFMSSFLEFHVEGMHRLKSLEIIRQIGI